MDTANTWVGLRLDPLDTLFFRDGRPFDAATRATGGLPQPQTLAGAIRTALLARTGFDFAGFARARKDAPDKIRAALEANGSKASRPVFDAAFRGPWLALAEGDDDIGTPLFPLPETLKRAKSGGWSLAKPVRSVPGWADPLLRPLWRKAPADPKAEAELLTLAGLKAFLAGGTDGFESVRRDGLTASDYRIGIAVNADTFTAAESMLYAISLMATRPKRGDQPAVCLYAEVSGTLADQLREPLLVPFGGEGKYVKVTRVSARDWPTPQPAATQAMWYLATPTFFPPTGRPLPMLPGLKAAASGAGVPVSGWDVARNGPKATRFAVPAGAVYFVEGGCTPNDFLNADPESDSLRQEGWGFALPGTWEGLNQ